MKNQMFNRMLLCLFAASVMACTPKKEETVAEQPAAVDAAQIKTEIQAMEDAYAAAMNSGKLDEIIYYSDDATSYSQDKKPFVGKKAIYQNLQAEIASMTPGTKVAYTTNEIFPSIDGSQVVEIGSYAVTEPSGGVISSGNFMAMFEKRNGKYFCVRDMGESDMLKKDKK